MRIDSVTAHAFGPLTDVRLDLAPGMTVITGANESAKSSWHAAMYMALVGRRRGKGSSNKDERHFADLHKPWDGSEWRVSTTITLDDGRRIELTQDLDGKVDCRAVDLDLSRDVSNQIMFEGSPDGSRFLGLDRKSFVATAVVNQAEMLSILTVADGLQEHLQRAAATAGSDATAATALAALDDFNREHVGRDWANSSKPLRAAKDRLARATTAASRARADHDDYLGLVVDAASHHARYQSATATTSAQEARFRGFEDLLRRVREATEAQREAERADQATAAAAHSVLSLSDRSDRARVLYDSCGGIAPVSAVSADSVSRAVASALAAWKTAPNRTAPKGPSADQIRAELNTLPQLPQGDIAVAALVHSAAGALAEARAIHDAHARQEPSAPVIASGMDGSGLDAAVAAGPAVVRDLASQLNAALATTTRAESGLSVAPRLEEARLRQKEALRALAVAEAADASARSADETVDASGASKSPPRNGTPVGLRAVMATAAVLCGAGGIAAMAMHQTVAGVVAIAVAAILAVAAALIRSNARRPSAARAQRAIDDPEDQGGVQVLRNASEGLTHAQQDVYSASRLCAELEGRAQAEAAAHRDATFAGQEVQARCSARGLPADPTRLQYLAAVAEQVLEYRSLHGQWSGTAEGYAHGLVRADSRLREALVAHGQPADPAVSATDLLSAYERTCGARASLAADAARRPLLVQALAARIAADEEFQAASRIRDQAELMLRDAARVACGDGSAVPQDLVAALEAWQVRSVEQLAETTGTQGRWAELQAVLDGRTLEDLLATAIAATSEHRVLTVAASAKTTAAEEARARAAAAAGAVGVDSSTALDVSAVAGLLAALDDEVRCAREQMLSLARVAENADGVATERARSLASVAEADEAVSAAGDELARVLELAATLELTREFLAAAQEQVHRDIAPVIAETLRTWLPQVTAGRYVDATVDPATLQVMVTGPGRRWRAADRLSVGTAEQVYLLLRLALAQHLTSPNETCPLLLDDVTVQADDERAQEILELLLRLSEDRQIVLFAQESAVAAWARHRLVGLPAHRLIELQRVCVE